MSSGPPDITSPEAFLAIYQAAARILPELIRIEVRADVAAGRPLHELRKSTIEEAKIHAAAVATELWLEVAERVAGEPER